MDRLWIFKISNSFLFILVILCEICTSEVPRPRGVSLSRATLYNPNEDFTCFDGSLTVPFSQVNDDYCDCPDASDEPGTSACPHGTFHCTNAGHKPLNIASSRVNDGVCDCCDASDEYGNKNSNCVNNCKDLGKSAREAAQRRAELLKAGKVLRAELSEKGLQLKQEMKEKLSEYKKNKSEADNVRAEKEEIKRQIEELENAALQKYREIEEQERKIREQEEQAKTQAEARESFIKFDSNQDGKIEVHELQVRQSFDRDRNGEVTVEEAKYFLNDKDSVELEEFINEAWSRIKPYLMMDAGLFKPPSDTEGEEQLEEEEHHEDNQEEGHPEELDEEQEGEGEGEEEYQEEPAHEETATPPKYDEETQKLIDQANAARNEFNTADAAVRDIQSEITKLEEYLGKDYGVDEEFASLQGQCFEYSDYEYIYRLCPFDKASQQPKSGASETRLGTWAKWTGPQDNKYSGMLYDHGQSCWNGPTRSTKVDVSCGSENKVISVSEPNRCEYKFEFETPAACREETNESDDVHDEL